MKLNQRFRRLVFAQVFLGIVAFGIAEPNPGLLLVAGAFALLSWYLTEGPGGRPLPRWAINLGSLAAVGWLLLDLFTRSGNVVISMGHFTMWLQVLLLYADKSNREYAQLLVLSLMTMIGASILSVSMLYGLLLVAYCGLGLVTLLHFHLKVTWDAVTDATRAAAPPGRSVPPPPPMVGRGHHWHFRFLTLVIGFVCAAVAVAVFVATPRSADGPMGEAVDNPLRPRTTGFSNEVRLGQGAPGTGDKEPVLNMQVRLHDGDIGEPMVFLLRGAALDQYNPDTRTWSRSFGTARYEHTHSLADTGSATLIETDDDEPLYEATITLRRADMRVLFTLFPTTRIESDNFNTVTYNPLDGQMSATDVAPGALIYKIHAPLQPIAAVQQIEAIQPRSIQDRPQRRRNADADNGDEAGEGERPRRRGRRWRSRSRPTPVDPQTEYARGWPGQNQRLARLAERALEPLGLARDPELLYDPHDDKRAAALERFLRDNYRYSLRDLPVPAGADPVTEFLFDQQQGHCEVFASAHAALCRAIGMQARVITGYRVSEYNRIGGYYVVRQSHAHAWTEVNLGPDRGWRPYDATPPDDISSVHRVDRTWLTTIRELYELVEYEWIRSVVAYDQRTRDAVLNEIQGSIKPADNGPTWLSQVGDFIVNVREFWKVDPANYTLIFFIVILLVVAVASLIRTLMVRHKRLVALQLTSLPRSKRRGLASRLRFYLTMLDMLERHGYVRPSWQSPFSFAQELAEANPMRFDPVVALTEIFYEIRFGHRTPDAQRREHIKAHLKQLEYALSSR